jgi:hypothetical protein
MTAKLIMTWDIAPEHDQDYFEFVVREFIPGVQRLGLQLSDAWATVYGDQPQIMVGALLPSGTEGFAILNSPEFKTLNTKLRDYVVNYSQKIVEGREGFQF